jgi:hypothetical protein
MTDETHLSDFEKAEIDQVHEAIRSYDNSRWQLAAFFGTANISSVAIGLSVQKYGVVLLSSIILLLLFVGDLMLKSSLIVPLYRGLKLEQLHARGRQNNLSFFRTYLAIHSRHGNRRKVFSELDAILELEDIGEIAERLRKLFIRPYGIRNGVTLVATFGILIELALGIFLALAGWNVF